MNQREAKHTCTDVLAPEYSMNIVHDTHSLSTTLQNVAGLEIHLSNALIKLRQELPKYFYAVFARMLKRD